MSNCPCTQSKISCRVSLNEVITGMMGCSDETIVDFIKQLLDEVELETPALEEVLEDVSNRYEGHIIEAAAELEAQDFDAEDVTVTIEGEEPAPADTVLTVMLSTEDDDPNPIAVHLNESVLTMLLERSNLEDVSFDTAFTRSLEEGLRNLDLKEEVDELE